MNYELKLILKVITMLFRQNGLVSGLDLSELLYELVSPPSDESEKLSQSGSEAITKDYYRDLLTHLRQLLMRGQPRVARTFAQNNGLFDHALALSYLLSFLSPTVTDGTSTNLGQLIDNGMMISTIRKFITTTLSPQDPLYVFYSHLLGIATNCVNTASDSGLVPPATVGASAKIDRLESFIILLANDIKFDKVEIADKSYRNLIDLMIALLRDDFNYTLPDELFNNDRFDCLLVNECLEFARFHGDRMNPKLMLRKLEFAFELFDFGFIKNASHYLIKLKTEIEDPSFNWKLVMDKQSKYVKVFLPEDALDDYKLLQNIWMYQMMKIFSRMDSNLNEFESPLFAKAESVDAKQASTEEDVKDVPEDEIEGAAIDEDKTDVVEDLEDEEIDVVELDTTTSESISLSKQEHSSLPVLQQPQQNVKQQHHSTMVTSAQKTPSMLDKSSSMNISSFSPIESNQTNTLNSGPNLQAQRKSLPNLINQNFHGPTLNPIMEVPKETQLNRQDSIDSASSPSTAEEINNNFNNTNDAFKMNSLKSSLPAIQPIQQQQTPMIFQPPSLPLTNNENTSFDFISTNGQVSSIPSYDNISLNDDVTQENDAQTSNYVNKNNEFLQNYSNSNQASINSEKTESFKNKEASNGETGNKQNSPNKSNNNGGLLNAIFGRLKPKNQMILPDDKDPQIIYDPVSKRWIDKSVGNQGQSAGMPPPPPRVPLSGLKQTQSEPNSTITSPNIPSLPTFSNIETLKNETNNISNDFNSEKISEHQTIANGNVPGPIYSSPTIAGPIPSLPKPSSNNAFRSDIRRKRYIDVLNSNK